MECSAKHFYAFDPNNRIQSVLKQNIVQTDLMTLTLIGNRTALCICACFSLCGVFL